MDQEKLNHFRSQMLAQLRTATNDVHADQAMALEGNDGVTDNGDKAELDLSKSTAFNLGERQLGLIEELDRALYRIEAGTYGECMRCGKEIDEARLEAMPSARYDAACEAAIEAANGLEEMPTL